MEITISRCLNPYNKFNYIITVTTENKDEEGNIRCEESIYKGFSEILSKKLTCCTGGTFEGIFTEKHKKIIFIAEDQLEVELEFNYFKPDEMTLDEIKETIIERVNKVKNALNSVEVETTKFKI